MNDDKVRMPTARAYREIVPNDGVLFEEVLEALREAQFATAVEAREAQARDQDCHVTTERLTASSELNATSTRFGSMLMALPVRKSRVPPQSVRAELTSLVNCVTEREASCIIPKRWLDFDTRRKMDFLFPRAFPPIPIPPCPVSFATG
jgi:hypothetical protein